MLSRTKFLYFVAFKFLISTELFNVVIRSIEFYLCREFFFFFIAMSLQVPTISMTFNVLLSKLIEA